MANQLIAEAAVAAPVEAPPVAPSPRTPEPNTPSKAPTREPVRRIGRNRPVASIPSLRLTEPPFLIRRVGWFLITIFVILPLLLALIPWRQAVYGNGMVIAFNPFDRPFTVESPIYGRVDEYYVEEGTYVRKGDKIADIIDIDEQYVATLNAQLDAANNQLQFFNSQIDSYENTRIALEATRDLTLLEMEQYVRGYEQKVEEMTAKRDESREALFEIRNTFSITANLYQQGLESREKYVTDQQKFKQSEDKLVQAEKALAGSEADLEAAKQKLGATKEKFSQELAKLQVETDAARGKVEDQQIKIGDLQVKMRRQNTLVAAPRDGYVLRLHQNIDAGAQVKDGDPIATIVPATDPRDMAAELYLPGRDIPLVHVGDPVRLQFDGWPAVQFIGWPSIAVGTFPGKVALVDRTQTKAGKFRVMVVPDPTQLKTTDPQKLAKELRAPTGWPSEQYLRQGAGAKGWVLLREVPLGFEIWRRINGFQPVIANFLPADKYEEKSADEPTGKDDKPKLKRPK